MAAPPGARGPLIVLGAFNLELARAPWASHEPLIARMRLQFWRDVVTGDDEPAHEVAGPLAALIAAQGLDRARLMRMIDAREVEVGSTAPFTDTDALWRYLTDGSGGLLALSVQALGGSAPCGPVSDAAEALGAAQGLANYLMAVPALAAAGRDPLPDHRPERIAALARTGLARIVAARPALRRLPKSAKPALLAAWRAKPLLTQAAANPGSVIEGALGQSEFARRGSLLLRSLIG